jgi:tetratricopeptide (TPR) repeat protein
MKALEKDRTRRFETASGLAMDIQRYLDNEPILARPPSKLYRFQKLVRRNRTAFAAIGAGVAALVVGLALSLHLFMRERQARQRAVAAERDQARMRQQAEQHAEWGDKLGRAGMLLTRGQFDEAERLISDVPPLPSMVPFFNVFGFKDARRGQWQPALSNYARAVEFMPSDYLPSHFRAALLLQTGDLDGYQHHRERMLRQFSGTPDPVIAERIAKDCLILPPPAADLETIGKMANTALVVDSTHKSWGDVYFVKGLAEYRQGRFASALEWLKKALAEKRPWTRKVQAQMVLAMAQHQLKQPDEARATLAQGLQSAERTLKKSNEDLDEDWNDWIIAHLLMNQAQALIEDKPKPDKETK